MHKTHPGLESFKALPANTHKVLLALSALPLLEDFVLVGGTGLALYLAHRQSKDLDFFTWNPVIDKTQIKETLDGQFGNTQLTNDFSNQQDWIVEGVKVTFCAKNWPLMFEEKQQVHGNISVAGFDFLVATKVSTLFVRAKFRDYYDLYAVAMVVGSLDKIYAMAQNRIHEMNRRLFDVALVYTDDIEDDDIDYLEPVYHVSKQQIAAYFKEMIYGKSLK
jgi:predicted nucleotidyltransferase component of viral defense system